MFAELALVYPQQMQDHATVLLRARCLELAQVYPQQIQDQSHCASESKMLGVCTSIFPQQIHDQSHCASESKMSLHKYTHSKFMIRASAFESKMCFLSIYIYLSPSLPVSLAACQSEPSLAACQSEPASWREQTDITFLHNNCAKMWWGKQQNGANFPGPKWAHYNPEKKTFLAPQKIAPKRDRSQNGSEAIFGIVWCPGCLINPCLRTHLPRRSNGMPKQMRRYSPRALLCPCGISTLGACLTCLKSFWTEHIKIKANVIFVQNLDHETSSMAGERLYSNNQRFIRRQALFGLQFNLLPHCYQGIFVAVVKHKSTETQEVGAHPSLCSYPCWWGVK